VFARVTTFQGSPDQIEAGITIFRENVIPWMREATGFRGWIVFLDRPGGRSLSVTFWATEQAAADAEASGSALRDEVAASVGATMQTLDVYEVAVVESLALGDTG
jgi:heme-degrading monooxygenase HmoA